MIRINNRQFSTSMEDVLAALQDELARRGSQLLHKSKQSGDYILVTCPYHKNGLERHPSAQFRKKDGLFYCFACKTTKSLPDVITHCLHEDGMAWLQRNFNNSAEYNRQVELAIPSREVEQKPSTNYVDKQELLQYRFIHPYMTDTRHIKPSILKLFDVGYDKRYSNITFPVKDINGNIYFIATRNIYKKQYRYPYKVEKPLYGLYELELAKKAGKKINSICVCESMINCLTCWTYGDYAIAFNGTGSYKQLEDLEKLPYRKLILMLDPDDAGRKGIEKILKKVKRKLIYVALLPDGKDVNDLCYNEYKNLKIITAAEYKKGIMDVP